MLRKLIVFAITSGLAAKLYRSLGERRIGQQASHKAGDS